MSQHLKLGLEGEILMAKAEDAESFLDSTLSNRMFVIIYDIMLLFHIQVWESRM